jgi:hypothetical protein
MILELDSGEEIEVSDEDLPALLRQLRESAPIIDANQLGDSIAKAVGKSVGQSVGSMVGSIGSATREALSDVLRTAVEKSVSKALANIKLPQMPNVILPSPALPQRLKVTNISRNRNNMIIGCEIEVVYDD